MRLIICLPIVLLFIACEEKKETDNNSWHSEPKDEFIITTAEQLMEFAKLVNEGHRFGKPIKLGNDIMLNDTTCWENWANKPPANKWVPIGKIGNPFKEFFNGNGHVISGIYINGAKDFQGLFGHVSLGSHITKIGVTASYVKGRRNVGIIVGNSDEGTLSNSYSAGIAHGYENVGGLVGKSYYGNVINNYSNSVVHGTEDVGGLVGTKRGGFLINGYFSGSVTGRKRVGSFMGSGKGAINCYYDKETLYSKEFVDNLNIFAGFISMKSWTYKAGLVNAWVYEAGKYPVLSDETLAYVDIGNGYGSEEIPYIISTEEQLKNITLLRSAGHLLDKHFKLGEDSALKNLGNAFVDSLIEKSGDSGIIEFIIEENLSIKTYPKNDKGNLKIFQVEGNKIEERDIACDEKPKTQAMPIENKDSVATEDFALQPALDYDDLKNRISARQQYFSELYSRASEENRAELILEAQNYLTSVIYDTVFPHWYGTPWSFYGNTRIPKQDSIACGYFVTGILFDVGFKIPRVKWAQLASEPVIVKIATDIKRFSHRPMHEVIAYINQNGDGLYIAGLDSHVGYIYKSGRKLRFVHSNYYYPEIGVMSEPLEGVNPLNDSEYRIIGKLFSAEMVKNWITGKEYY